MTHRRSQEITVSVTVTNTGKAVGKEIAQVYVKAPKGNIEKPAQELKVFAKTCELKPGESQTLTMTIDKANLASFNEKQSAWVVDGGTYIFNISASSRDVKSKVTAKICGQRQRVNNVLFY